MKKNFFLLLLGFILMFPMSMTYARAICQADKAYIVGVRDGSKNWRFQKKYGLRRCGRKKQEVNQAYIQGYQAGKAGIELAKKQCVKIDFGRVCGYHCKRGKDRNQVKCASSPIQNCLVDDDGNVHCGYSCVKARGKVKCGTSFLEKCVVDGRNIRCGKNCHKTNDGVKCDSDVQA